MTYQDLIAQFVFSEFPKIDTTSNVFFESVFAEVMGTKQRRFGPMPDPETQVLIRKALRPLVHPEVEEKCITFFLPWGSRKQEDGQSLDILEFLALKQLVCLRESLHRFDVDAVFVFRMEDLTDRYLLSPRTVTQASAYMTAFEQLATKMLGDRHSFFVAESNYTTYESFHWLAAENTKVFFDYLRDTADERVVSNLEKLSEPLRDIGWTGVIPHEQREYYMRHYKTLGLTLPLWEMAKYFGATLARVKLHATGQPEGAVQISFAHPIPGNPVNRPRVFYRTIPDRYTHQHKSPWLTHGYFRINRQNDVCPRYVEPGSELQPNTINVGGVVIDAPYISE